jgi:hypothetical protein
MAFLVKVYTETMGVAAKRRNLRVGSSSIYLNIPRPIAVGRDSTIAGDRLILADPRGEISETELLEFLERRIEPLLWRWLHGRRRGVRA